MRLFCWFPNNVSKAVLTCHKYWRVLQTASKKGSSEQRQSWETFQKGKDIKTMGFCSYYCGSCVSSHCCPGFHSHHHAHYGCAYFHSHFGCCSAGGCFGHGCRGSCCSRFGIKDLLFLTPFHFWIFQSCSQSLSTFRALPSKSGCCLPP